MKYNYEIGDKVIYYDKEFVIVSTVPDGSGVFICGHWVDINNIKPINKGEQMTNKQEAKQQLEKLEAEVQKLKEIINKPEKAGSLLEDGGYHIINGNNGRAFQSFFSTSYKYGCNSFDDGLIAQAYAEAFNTMLELRKCAGSCIVKGGTAQYTISPTKCKTSLEIDKFHDYDVKLFQISPSYLTIEYAQAAIDKVGKDNIIKMFKTLHGIYV